MGHSRSILSGIAAVLVAVAGCQPRNEFAPPPPPTVTVAHPVERPVVDHVEFTGTTQSTARVDLRARVRGYLEGIHFEDGATVEEGDLLFVIDKAPFEAALAAARAQLAEARATLEAARESKQVLVAEANVRTSEAQLGIAQLDEARGRQLLNRGAQAREEYDRQVAALRTAQADAEAKRAALQQAEVEYRANIALAEAAVANAEAAVTNAELDLGYTEIRAPIGGRIGRHLVDVGNLVQAELTLLATIEAYDPIYVYFTISDTQLLRFARLLREGRLPSPDEGPIPLAMALEDEEGFPHEGRFDFAEVGVDPETGTALRRGVFPNPDGAIVPGLYTTVRAAVGSPRPRLLVPEQALGADQRGRFALVVDAEGVVEYRPVVTGIEVEGLRVIERGLEADDWVVVNGLLRARPGAKVNPERGDALAVVTGRGPGAQAEAPTATPPARGAGPRPAQDAGADRPASSPGES